MRGRLRVDRPVVQDAKTVLALDNERIPGLRERSRDQAAGHELRKRDRAAKGSAHGCESAAAQEPSPGQRRRCSSPHQAVGALGVFGIQLVNAPLANSF